MIQSIRSKYPLTAGVSVWRIRVDAYPGGDIDVGFGFACGVGRSWLRGREPNDFCISNPINVGDVIEIAVDLTKGTGTFRKTTGEVIKQVMFETTGNRPMYALAAMRRVGCRVSFL